jgi:hypothetical protein
MPIVDFFPIDDDRILQEAGAKFIAIIEPKLVVGHNGRDNRLIEIDITANWQQVGSKQLAEQSRCHFSEEITAKLLIYVGNKVYVEKADIIAEIQSRKNKNRNDDDYKVDDNNDGDDSKAIKALELAITNSKELFVNEFGRPFAAMRMRDGHVEVHPMDEQRFKNWISGIYYNVKRDLLSEDDLKKIVRILISRAEFDENIRRHRLDVRVRGYNKQQEEKFSQDSQEDVGTVGYVGGMGETTENFEAIYYDLTNKKWETIKITPEGWDIDNNPPILFRRYGSELPQPYPDRNYDPDVLDKFPDLINLKPEYKETQKQLLKPLIITMLWPNTTAKPILILPAAQGSAKTTAFELIRDLVDPNATLTTSLPKEDFNLKQNLSHNFVAFFDNVSDISDSQSDVLCRAVTGAGDMKRKLYENDEDIIYNYRRIIGLNGITNAATRADLLDRGLIIEFGEIPKKQRKLLRVIRRQYFKLKPKLLAFCLDVISEVMKERQKWQGIDDDYFGMKDLIDEKGGLPRMADWAILAEQVSAIIARKEGKEYKPGTFLEAFDKNLEILNTEALKSSLLAEALIHFMTDREAMKKGVDLAKYGDSYPHWEGSPTMLLAELNDFIASNSESIKINTKAKTWPQDPAVLGKELARIAHNLRALGIVIDSKRTEKNILYNIAKLPTFPTFPTGGDNSRSNDAQNPVSSDVGLSTFFPTSNEGQNHAQNELSCRDVGAVGKKPDLGGYQLVSERENSSSLASPINLVTTTLFWEIYDKLENQRLPEPDGKVGEIALKQALISSGQFHAGDATQLIKGMIAKGELMRLEFDVLSRGPAAPSRSSGSGGGAT